MDIDNYYVDDLGVIHQKNIELFNYDPSYIQK